MVTALLLPVMTISLTATAESTDGLLAPLYVDPENYHVILHGKDNMYQEYNVSTPAPEMLYTPGDNPPIMVGKENIENGKIVAFGGVGTFRGGSTYRGQGLYPGWIRWKKGEFDNFIDNVWQWLNPGAVNVLWYSGYGAYHAGTNAEYFIDNMKAAPWNYNVTEDSTEPIANINLSLYDILVIPQVQLGAGAIGGDPTLLPDTDVDAIEDFVKAGGGLFICEGSDYATYNFYRVHNKILERFGFLYRFQSDSLMDNVNYRESTNESDGDPPHAFLPVVDVDSATDVGTTYGANEVGLYAVSSLRELLTWGVTMSVKERYQDSLPGTSVTFEVTVNNTSDVNIDNFDLTVSDDAGWCSTDNLNVNPLVSVENGTSATATLTVKVPNNAPYRMKDNITITATSQGDNTKSDNSATSVYVSTWIAPPTDDVGAVQGDAKADTPQGAKEYMYVGSGGVGTKFQNERGYLQFDLSDGLPAGYTIENARLYLYCFRTMGPSGENIRVYGLDNDDWSEVDTTWNNQPAGSLTLLDTVSVAEEYAWYSWDVKSFVETEFAGNKKVSFLVRAETEGASSPDNFSYGFDTEEYTGSASIVGKTRHPYIVFGVRPVASYFTENYGSPGEDVVVNAVINNRGAVVDNYDLTIASQSAWTVNPSSRTENNLQPGENREVPVTVTIPGGATPKTWENLILTVTSKTDSDYSSSTTDAGVWVGYIFDLVGGKWNLVGFPATDENTAPDNVLPETYYIWRWDPVGGTYVSPSSTVPVDENIGYWIWVEDGWEVRIGVPVASGSISLVGGKWNLVHFPATNANTTPDNLFAGYTYYIWKWDPVGGTYVSPSSTAPVELSVGYWVWIDSDKTVTVPVV